MVTIQNSRVLITGARRGIGFSLAKAFARKKCHLLLLQRDFSDDQTQELLRLGALSVDNLQCDLSSYDSVQNAVQKIKSFDRDHSIDIFVNNAGVLTGDLLEHQSDTEIANVIQVNLTSGILMTKAVLFQMLEKKSGLIVSQCSVSSYMRFPCASTYAATKAGLLAFTECLEVELKGTGVRTLSLITPAIKTDMLEALKIQYGKYFKVPRHATTSEEYADKVIRAIESNKTYLLPVGVERVGLFLSRYAPRIFKAIVVGQFTRNTLKNVNRIESEK